MELDNVLLGLINMHQGVTGYELNRIMKESTGYLVAASLSHIYPSLRKLTEAGLLSYLSVSQKNRPDKKVYSITKAGVRTLHKWLCQPIPYTPLDFKPFLLRMSFSPLMSKDCILEHIDREIKRLKRNHLERERDIHLEVEYLDTSKYDRQKAELLWSGINQVSIETEALHLDWLKKWREKIFQELAPTNNRSNK